MPAIALGGIVAIGSRLPANVWRAVPNALAALDTEHGGTGSISGIVTQQGQPARKQVLLLAWPALTRVAATMSAGDGAYSFQRLRLREYLVVGVDETRTLDPEAKLVVAS